MLLALLTLAAEGYALDVQTEAGIAANVRYNPRMGLLLR